MILYACLVPCTETEPHTAIKKTIHKKERRKENDRNDFKESNMDEQIFEDQV